MANNIEYKSAVKKNLIDMLMFSLYADARTIYREYVQNALDSINVAVKQRILTQLKDGVVNINIDKTRKTIVIRDNGTGIKADVAVSRLLDISASTKDGVTAAGQFGIGRLVGCGYCHKLVFKTSAWGEDIATIVTFDVDSIWKMVKEDSEDYLASDVIDRCTSKEYVDEDKGTHYFEVKLYDVKNEAAPSLLNESAVISYLNMTAPVGYTPEFTNAVIYHSTQAMPEYKDLHENLEKVQVCVGQHRIEKQYGLTVRGTKDAIDRLEYFKIGTKEYGLLAWGWFALTKFSIQIPKEDDLACIRLRKHNIQIGDFNLLSGKPLWKEERGNSYFYGEIFVVHKNIVPNAARDGLAPTPEKEALYIELEKFFKGLQVIYTKANAAKKAIEKIQDGAKKIAEAHNTTDRIALDNIDNKGVGVYDKLVKSATYAPLKHMLELYKDDYERARQEVDKAKQSVLSERSESADSIEYENVESINVPTDEHEYKNHKEQEVYQKNDTISPHTAATNSSTVSVSEAPRESPNVTKDIIIGSNPKGKPSIARRTFRGDIFVALEKTLSKDEVWILRRVFKVMNYYCPQNEHDQHLIDILQKEIVREFENE